MKRAVISIFFLGLTLPSASVAAPDSPANTGSPTLSKTQLAAAKRAWTDGARLFAEKSYDQALERFAAGYKLANKPGFLFNMAECHKQLGNKAKARAYYDHYLKEGGKKFRKRALDACAALGYVGCRDEPKTVGGAQSPKSKAPVASTRATKLTPVAAKSQTQTPKKLSPTDFRPLRRRASTPFYKHWGFWTGIGAAVVAGTVTAVVLATQSGSNSPSANYTLGPPKP
jgi:hypothetical protein